MAINLLPQGIALKGKDKIVLTSVGKFVSVGFVIFLLAAFLIVGYFIYLSLRIRASISLEETLKSQIGSLEQTEQSFFLIKDRIGKIKSVLAKENVRVQTETLSGVVGSFPPGVRILEIQMTSQKVTLTLIFSSSESFGIFYKGLIEAKTYKTIVLKTFSFNPSTGYIATMELTND